MFNKKRIVVIVLFLILSFLLITYGASRGKANINVSFFDGFNDKLIDKQVIKSGENAKVPEEPEHENYVFAGWYLYDSIDTLVTNFKNIKKDLKVEARYEDDKNNNGIADKNENYYDVRFIDGVTGEVLKTESVLTGLGAIAPTPLVHSNYTFIGWDKDYSIITSNLDVTASYNGSSPAIRVMYTLRFHDKDGTVFNTQTILKGNAGGYVPAPSYEGYTFIGWYLGVNGTNGSYTMGSIVTKDLDIYAYYTIDEHEVIIDPEDGDIDGGDTPIEEEQIVDYGTEIELPNALKEYTLTYNANGEGASVVGNETVSRSAILLGWCKNSNTCNTEDLIPVGTKVIITDDVSYHAVWGNANSAITLTNALRLTTESTVYTFAGWALSENGTKEYNENESLTLTKNTDLYAVWSESTRKYEVTLNGNIDGENNPSNLKEDQEIDYNTEITLPGSVKEYTLTYHLNGGILTSGNTEVVLNVPFKGWCKDKTECTEEELIPALGKSTILANTTFNAIHNNKSVSTVILKATKEEDNYNTYEFLGWATSENGSVNEDYNALTEVKLTKNTDLYAVYKVTKIDYTLTLNTNGGTISENDKIEDTYGYGEETKVFPTPTKNYTLTYNTNGGTLTDENIDRVASAKFLGWCEGTSDTCDTYVTKTNMTSSKTYTAAWGTSEEEITLASATKESKNGIDYTFKEWFYDNTVKSAGDKLYLSSDLTVNARYTESAVITVDPNITDETEGRIIDTPESNPSEITDGDNTFETGTKIKLPNLNNYYILTYVPASGLLLGSAKEVNYVEATLLGWCNKVTCTTEELIAPLTEVTVEKAVTYKAVWGNAKTETVIASADKTDNEEYDYTFMGWALTENGEVNHSYDAGSSITLNKNLTLYAKYNEVKQKYDVTINGDIDEKDNSSDLKEENNLDYGTEIELPNSLLNYTLTYHTGLGTVNSGNNTITRSAEFLGWCKNSTECLTSELLIKGSKETVTANVTYNAVFGNATSVIKIVGATKPADNYNTYTFVGWATTINGTVNAKYNVNNEIILSDDLDLYAVYTSSSIDYKLTLNPNGGTIADSGFKTSYGYGETTEAFPTPTKSYELTYDANGVVLSTNEYETISNVQFLGWCEGTSDSCSEYVTSTEMTANKTYTAAWGNAEELDLISATKESTLTKTYEFNGWFDGNSKYTTSITLTKDTTLVADFTESTRKYEVCFDSAYDKENLPSTQSKEYNDLVTEVSDLTSENHVFIVWITEKGNTWNFASDKVTSNVNLYAKWQNSLTFESNGGIISGTTPSALQEENAVITLPNITKNYTLSYEENGGVLINDSIVSATFIGWCKDSETCENPLAAGTSQAITTNTKYYAVWGSAVETIKLPATTKNSDNYNTYEFAGWGQENNETVNYTEGHDLLIDENKTLYAVYKVTKIDYTLTLNTNGGTIPDSGFKTSYGYGETTEAFPTPTMNYTLTYNANGGTLTDENIDRVASAKFLGWCEGTSDTCDTYVTNAEMTSNKTYTAAWGTSEEALTLTSATKDSSESTVYTFKEWFYDNTVKNSGDKLYLSDNLTVNARYTETVREYNVKYEKVLLKADGVTENSKTILKNESVPYGTNYTNNEVETTENGYTCSSWDKTIISNINSDQVITSKCIPNLIGLRLEKETAGVSLSFKLYESVDIKDKVKVYKEYTGNEFIEFTDESEYTINNFSTNTVGKRDMTASYNGLTSNSLEYTVEGYSSNYDTLFEVRFMTNSYRKTTDRSCKTGPCDSNSATTIVETNHNFLEVIEYYDQNIKVNSIKLTYTDNTSVTLEKSAYDNIIRWNRVSTNIYHPVILASQKLTKLSGDANYRIDTDVMPSGKIIDEVRINYTISYTSNRYVVFKYNNGTTGEGSFTPDRGGNN